MAAVPPRLAHVSRISGATLPTVTWVDWQGVAGFGLSEEAWHRALVLAICVHCWNMSTDGMIGGSTTQKRWRLVLVREVSCMGSEAGI